MISAALGDSTFLFADDVKIVFHTFFRLGLVGKKWDLPINPNKCVCLTVGNLPLLSPSFSVAETDHHIPHVTDVRDLGVPLDTTFATSAHCIEAANTARRLLFLVRRSFCELSKTAFAPLYSALVRSQH